MALDTYVGKEEWSQIKISPYNWGLKWFYSVRKRNCKKQNKGSIFKYATANITGGKQSMDHSE